MCQKCCLTTIMTYITRVKTQVSEDSHVQAGNGVRCCVRFSLTSKQALCTSQGEGHAGTLIGQSNKTSDGGGKRQ